MWDRANIHRDPGRCDRTFPGWSSLSSCLFVAHSVNSQQAPLCIISPSSSFIFIFLPLTPLNYSSSSDLSLHNVLPLCATFLSTYLPGSLPFSVHLQHLRFQDINYHHLSWLLSFCVLQPHWHFGVVALSYPQFLISLSRAHCHWPCFFSPSCLSDSSAEVMEVDHDRQLVFCETLCVSSLTALSPGRVNGGACSSNAAGLGLLGAVQPSDEQVAARLSAPVVTTQLDTRNIAFERSDTILICAEC